MTELSGQVTDDHGDTSEGSELTSKFFYIFLHDDSANGDSFRVAYISPESSQCEIASDNLLSTPI